MDHSLNELIGREGEKVHFKTGAFDELFDSRNDEPVADDFQAVKGSEGVLAYFLVSHLFT